MYFEQFEIGQRFTLDAVLITAEEIDEFARKYDPQPIHIDSEFAENGPFKGIIASGLHTASVIWNKWVQSNRFSTEILGGTGLDHLQWPAPVRPGDRLYTEVEVVGQKRSSSGKRGLLTLQFTASNQDDTVVLKMQCNAFLKTMPQ
ncbi:MaoC/PaaZ C-terminal domain-containing protein [Aneurinibacillus sp. REN35]|uniref:MaoC/PaaZ C-terminal domain-containing protein n=1 Tax=Aneurinibacillus sp. REN35 TaxID=3237286 RepID=UPI0035280976